jgi:glucose/mannose transport system permease protein
VEAGFNPALVGAVRVPEAAVARRRYLVGRVTIYGLLLLFALVYAFPAYLVISGAFRTPADVAQYGRISLPTSFSFEPWIRAWTKACVTGRCQGIQQNFYNSLMMAIPATAISTLVGALTGYVLSKWRFRGANFIFLMIVAGVFIPGQTTLLPWAWIVGKVGLANNVLALIIIHSVQTLCFSTLFCRNFYVGVPDELIKAGQVDGAGFWRIYFKVILPLSPPILIVTVIWQFTTIWNEYLFGMVFTSGSQQPITAAVMGVGTGSSAAAVLIAAGPPILIYLFGGRFFIRGLTQGAIK